MTPAITVRAALHRISNSTCLTSTPLAPAATGQLSGNAVEYRIRLIERIGQERVERLESDNDPRRFDIPYLQRIKSIFTRKARALEKRRARRQEAA
ncbi:NinG-like phage protein [Enterobacter cloacae]|uniref:NinG-like phage protein n=1 Tax=Enterobacter cloacae TaxID=550 RepID=A0A377LZN9_ENTCL|nr:NinG-like phage protein [Enterobacter cloacae]